MSTSNISVCVNPNCREKLSSSNTANGCRRCVNDAHRKFKTATLGDKKKAKEWYRFLSAKKSKAGPKARVDTRVEAAHVTRRLKEVLRSRGDKAVFVAATREQTNNRLFAHNDFQKMRGNEVKRRHELGKNFNWKKKKV